MTFTSAGAPVQKAGAFFDMDYTLLSGSSGLLYLRYLGQIHYFSARQWVRIFNWVGQYMAGKCDFPHLMARLLTQVAGSSEDEAWRVSTEWFQAMLRHYISDDARQRVAWHQAQGHHVAIVSAATPYVVRHVARDLGLGDAYLATHPEVVDGQFTGRVIEPACYGEGKLILTKVYAADQGIDLSQSYFYTDSHHDLSLLQAVGNPIAVNPGSRLRRIAVARGWPVVHFHRSRTHRLTRH